MRVTLIAPEHNRTDYPWSTGEEIEKAIDADNLARAVTQYLDNADRRWEFAIDRVVENIGPFGRQRVLDA